MADFLNEPDRKGAGEAYVVARADGSVELIYPLSQGHDEAIILLHLLSCQLRSGAGRRKVVSAS